MPRATLALVSAMLAILLQGPTVGARARDGSLVGAIDAVRAGHGLARLSRSSSLERSARAYARFLAERGAFAHAGHIRASHSFGMLGEVLALQRGWRPAPRRMLSLWLHSPEHREVLLSGRYRWIGVGRARGLSGDRPTTVWVAQLGG